MSIPRITGSLIRQLRKNSGLTQAQLAEKAGITQGYIAQIEREKADPKLSVVNRIFEVFEEKGQAILARDIMTTNLLCCGSEQITEEITVNMIKGGYSQVPVLDKRGYCVGTLIENDLLVKIMKKGHALRWAPVKDVMGPPLPTFHENTPVEIIERVIEKIPAVLITEMKGIVVGIITRSDVLRQF